MKNSKLNELDYNVLAILLDKELSGYDITQWLKYFRNTSHSRIYPVLAKLEGFGYVEYRDVAQVGKPDKKLYHLTTEGLKVLRDWVADEKNIKVPKIKDEELVRMLCLHLLDDEEIIKQIKLRKEQIESYNQKIIKILECSNGTSLQMQKQNCLLDIREMAQFFMDSELILLDWALLNIENKGKPKQPWYEYIKERL